MLKAVTRVTYYLLKIPEMVTRKWQLQAEARFELLNMQFFILPRDGDEHNHFVDPHLKTHF